MVFDSGTSVTIVPARLWPSFKSHLKQQLPVWATLRSASSYLSTDCDEVSNFPEIALRVQDYWLELKPEDYFLRSDDTCMIGFISG